MNDLISRAAAITEIMADLNDRSLHDDLGTPEDYAEGYDEGIRNAAAIVLQMPPAQPVAKDINVPVKDCISRQAVIALAEEIESKRLKGEIDLTYAPMINGIKALPSAQPNLSEAYSKAVFTWLMDYQIRTAELNGRYTPYEVLSWVINDWRKENE